MHSELIRTEWMRGRFLRQYREKEILVIQELSNMSECLLLPREWSANVDWPSKNICEAFFSQS